MQTFQAVGRLVRDPEMTTTQSGVAKTRFTLAVDRQFKNANGEKEADFLSCQAWRKTGELIAQYCKKGAMISIQGEVRTGSYEKNGQRVYTTDIVVSNVKFLDTKSSTNNGANQQNATGNQYGGNQYGGNQGGFQQQQQQSYNQQPSYQNSGVNNDPFAGGQQQNNGAFSESDLPF